MGLHTAVSAGACACAALCALGGRMEAWSNMPTKAASPTRLASMSVLQRVQQLRGQMD